MVMGQIDFNSNLQLLATAPTSIGVAPLETDADPETLDFVSGKSDLKVLLFPGYAHPGVFSASPPYTDSPLRECATISNNSEAAWMDALEYNYREGWRSAADHARRIQEERNIDRVARESWAPAIEACVLPRPVRGAELYEVLTSFSRMDSEPASALGYMAANPDVGRNFVSMENGAWDHYRTHGKGENRSLIHDADALSSMLTQLDRESDELFRALRSKMVEAQNSARLSYLQHEIQRLQAEVKDLRTSYSWKITSPLRALAKPVMGRMARPK
jgi:hypothetical protein